MNDLYRELAPIAEEAWKQIEDQAKQTLKLHLAARKLVDFVGPLGWQASAVSLGHSQALGDAPVPGVEAALRRTQPLVETKVPFELSRNELESIARGARDADLQPVIDAAKSAALTEDKAIFHGYAAANIQGICEANADKALPLIDNYVEFPRLVAEAISRLRDAGVDGPYALALGRQCFTGLTQTTTSGGYPVMQHVRREIDGPMIWAPAVDGGVVLSLRGGDFELTVGRDFSLGYHDHDQARVRLYLQESFTFRPVLPEAAIPLSYAKVELSHVAVRKTGRA